MLPVLTKSSRLSPDHRFVIVFHSPDAVVETGLLVCPREKKAGRLDCRIGQDTFSGPVWESKLAKLRPIQAISQELQAGFSVVQAAWRRDRDSNSGTVPGTCKSPHVRELHPILQQQHTVGEWDEGWTRLGLLRFHPLEKGECSAMVRPKGIHKVWGISHFGKRLAMTACLPRSQESKQSPGMPGTKRAFRRFSWVLA